MVSRQQKRSVEDEFLACVKGSDDGGLLVNFTSTSPTGGLKFTEVNDFDAQVIVGESDETGVLAGFPALLVFRDTVASYVSDDPDCGDA